MHEDDQIILIFYIIFWITLLLVVIKSSKKRKVLLFNIRLQIVYTIIFIVNVFTAGPGGGILAVIVIWMAILAGHWLTLFILIIISLLRPD